MSEIQIPKGWELYKLSDCCKIISGYAFKSNLFNKQKGIPLIRIRDLNTNSTITRYQGKYENQYLVKTNDFLIGMDGDFKIYRWKGPESLLNQRVCRLYDFKSTVNPKFIFYAIQEHLRKIHRNTPFTTVKHISIYQISDINIAIPKKDTQDKIVQKLEYILGEIEEKKKLILELQNKKTILLFSENYLRKGKNFLPNFLRSLQDAILRSVYEQTFDGTFNRNKPEYRNTSISEVCDLISGQHILQENYNLRKIGIPYLTGPDDFGEKNPLITKWTEKPRAIAKKDDILITVKGAGVGKINILDIEQAAISRQLMAIRPRNFNHEYLYYFLLLNYNTIKKIGIGTTVPGIDRQSILKISFPFPSLEIQDRHVQMIKEKMKMLDAFRNHLPSILDRYDLLRKHLEYLPHRILEQAFSGKLVN